MLRNLLVFLLTFFLGLLFSQTTEQTNSNLAEEVVIQSRIENSEAVESNSQTDLDPSERRFASATGKSDKEVVDFFVKFQNSLAAADKKTVASMLEYPVCVRFAAGDLNRKGCRLLSRKEFLKNYDRIFDGDFKEFIENIDVNKEGQLGVLWANWRGVTMDRGQIWFEGICRDRKCNKTELKFTTLSSGFLQRPYDENNHRESAKNDAN